MGESLKTVSGFESLEVILYRT